MTTNTPLKNLFGTVPTAQAIASPSSASTSGASSPDRSSTSPVFATSSNSLGTTTTPQPAPTHQLGLAITKPEFGVTAKAPSFTLWSPLQLSLFDVPRQNDPLTHAKMYAMAHLYGIPALKELAKEKFKEATVYHYRTKEFVQSIHVVYTTDISAGTGLRDIVKKTILAHLDVLRIPEVEAALRELPGLSFEVLRESLGTSYNASG